jgi:hypothetical protein
MQDLGGDEYRKNTEQISVRPCRVICFSIFPLVVPAQILHERFVLYLSSMLFFLINPPMCGSALFQDESTDIAT